MFELRCRNAPRAGNLLCRFRHQRTRHIVAISPPRFCGMTGCEPMASLIEELPDQRAARASGRSVSRRRSGTELVLHAVPCLAIDNCLVLPGVAAARLAPARARSLPRRGNPRIASDGADTGAG